MLASARVIGYKGGFLNKREIIEDLNRIFIASSIPRPEKQPQQAGIDLTVARVVKGPFSREIRFGSDGWMHLTPGRYWAEFNEIPRETEDHYRFHLWPRSTHFRQGNFLSVGLGKVSGQKDGIMGSAIDIGNPKGLWLERNAAICQATIESLTKIFLFEHSVKACSAPLTVERIFRFTSEARLGIEERHVETEEIELGETILLGQESFLVRYAETILVAENELVTSLKDNPYPFLWAMGAVADPGYHGKLHSCVSSGIDYRIYAGLPMLQLRKDTITPVSPNLLYKGRYQGLGSEDGDQETVKWFNPADPRAWVQGRDMVKL